MAHPHIPRPAAAGLGRRRLLALAGAWAAAAGSARAAPGGLPSYDHTSNTPEFETIAKRLFPGRNLVAGQQVVQLQAPLRAAYGASVPVKVLARQPQSDASWVKRLHLIVDQNPSPVAASIELTRTLARADLETRLRVDTYSHVRVVAELSNGELHTDSRFVKTSGGCSAPPNRDALHLIGKTVLKVAEPLRPGQPLPAEVTVIHPNDTGFELNNQTVMYIPPHFVRQIRLRYGDALLFDAEMDFSFSENPTLRFAFVPPGPGELVAEVTDSREQRFEGRLRLG